MESTVKRLIDEHANDDLSSAPDESDILEAALDFISERGLVQGQSNVSLFPSQLPMFDGQQKDVNSRDTSENRVTKETSEENVENLKSEGTETPDDGAHDASDSEVPPSPEISRKSRALLDDDNDEDSDANSLKESPTKGRVKSRVLELSDEEGEKEEVARDHERKEVDEEQDGDGGGEEESKQGADHLISDIFGESGEESHDDNDIDVEESQQSRKPRKRSGKQHTESDKPRKRRKQREASVGEEIDVEESKPEIKSDFDLMLEKRREMRKSSRRRKRKDEDLITENDDLAHQLIEDMKQAAEEDRQLNVQGVAATRKLRLLPKVLRDLQRADYHLTLLESGVLPVFTEWLAPLPDKSLPHLQIREGILKALQEFPPINSDVLKSSCIGKAVMLLFRHPKETRQNKDRAGKLINDWARPIFGLVANVKKVSREDREKQDYSNMSKFRRRVSSSDSVQNRKSIERSLRNDQPSASKPGDPGWCPRARVPQPSNRDYVVRPKWNIEQEIVGTKRSGPDRYEKHARRFADKRSRNSVQRMRASNLSITGSKMDFM